MKRIVTSIYKFFRRKQSLKPVVRAVLSIPVLGSCLHRLASKIVTLQGRAEWVQTPYGWLKLEPLWEKCVMQGRSEDDVCDLLPRILKPGDCFYDLGAYKAFYSFMALHLIGQEAKVFAFEPDPDNVALIREEIARNAATQLVLSPSAVWSSDGNIQFRRSGGIHIGGCVDLGRGMNIGLEEEISVPAISLDSFAESHPEPTVVKVDVEGAEFEVLRGAQRLLSTVKPVLVLEIHNAVVMKQIQQFLPSFGYSWEVLGQPQRFPFHALAASAPSTPVLPSPCWIK